MASFMPSLDLAEKHIITDEDFSLSVHLMCDFDYKVVDKACSKWGSGCTCMNVYIRLYMYAYIYIYVCLVSVTLCFSVCVREQCLCERAVSFGLVVSIIRSLSFTPSLSRCFSQNHLLLLLTLPLTLSSHVLHFSVSLSLFLHLPLACICASEWWVLNHRFILCAMMNEGKSLHFSLFILHSISVPICLFIHPTMYPSLSV